jgi:outer membrane protein
MKKRIALTTLFGVAVLCQSALAGPKDFVEEFLRRYKPSTIHVPAMPSAENALAERIRDGDLPLTVSDLVDLVLKNNLDIGISRLTPFSTRTAIDSAYRPFDPSVHVGATVSRNTSPSLSQLSGAPSVSQLSHNYTMGFSKMLESGGTAGVELDMSRSSSNNAFSTFNPSWNGMLKYSFTQPLLRNYGREANTLQIRIAKNNGKISESQFERQVIDLVTQALKTYWDLAFTTEDLKVKQRSVELARSTFNDNQKQVAIGTLAQIDVVQSEKEVASRNEQLLITRHTQTQIEDQVKKLVVSTADPGMVLARVSPAQAAARPKPDDVLPVAEAIRVAIENRPEMRELGLNLENRELDVKTAKNQLLPQLDGIASFTQNGVGGTETLRNGFGATAPIISTTKGGLFDSVGQLFGYNYTGWSVGFNLTIPIANRAQQADYSRAATERQTAENRFRSTAQQIALEVREAIDQVEMNAGRIETARLVRELAIRTSEAEQKKFDLGASTVHNVLEFQRDLAQAETDEIAALVNYAKSLVDYDHAIGGTLKKYNVEIEKTLGK